MVTVYKLFPNSLSWTLSEVYFEQVSYKCLTLAETFNITVFNFVDKSWTKTNFSNIAISFDMSPLVAPLLKLHKGMNLFLLSKTFFDKSTACYQSNHRSLTDRKPACNQSQLCKSTAFKSLFRKQLQDVNHLFPF